MLMHHEMDFLEGQRTARLILAQMGRPGALDYFRNLVDEFGDDDSEVVHLTPAFMQGFDTELSTVGGTA